MKYNIFQGNKQLQRTVSKTLGFDINEEYLWQQTSEIYFEAYFYLCNRFGMPKVIDPEYKKIMIWRFTVKNYTITIELNSSCVSFIVFGNYRISNTKIHSPYWVKYAREYRRKQHLLIENIDNISKRSDYESKKIQELFDEFQQEKNIPDTITPEEFNEKYGQEFWWDRIDKFNKNIIGIDYKDYDFEYENSKTRHALKTLEQFIKNMLTPICVRDCSFNIKGRLSDKEAHFFNRYDNNVKIKLKK